MNIHPILTLISTSAALGAACGGPSVTTESENTDQVVERAFPAEEELHSLIKARVDAKRATGIVLGVREADGSHTIVAYGDPGPGTKPLGPKSVFEIGSVSKVFTGILLAEMASRGEVGIEDPVAKHAHEGVTIPSRGTLPIRLVDLSTHMSGLPRLPANLIPKDANNPYAQYSDKFLHDFLSGHSLQRDVGAKQEYSNLGTGLLGHLLGSAASSDWATLSKERILVPLGMQMSGVALDQEMQAHLALGHDHAGAVVSNWDFASLAGAGAMRSNAEDMLRFIDANLGASEVNLGKAPKALLAAMQISHEPRVQAGPNMQIGLNWFTKTANGHTIVWHNGGTGGYRTFVGFDKNRNIGVVVFENSTHGSDDIGFHLLDPKSPLDEAPTVRKEVTVAGETLATYVGVYALNPTFHLNITLVDGALYSQATNQPMLPIFAESDSDFFLKAADAQLSFIRGSEDKVTGLVLHQNGADVEAKRLVGDDALKAIASIIGPARKEVAVSTSVLKDYLGVYELNPSFKIVITLKDDTLQVQATNQPTLSIYAESESKFFFKVVDAQISFVRGSKGKITNLILHQGGMNQSASKVK